MAPPDPADPLGELRERLRATQEAAARLAGDDARVPPQGWAAPPRGEDGALSVRFERADDGPTTDDASART